MTYRKQGKQQAFEQLDAAAHEIASDDLTGKPWEVAPGFTALLEKAQQIAPELDEQDHRDIAAKALRRERYRRQTLLTTAQVADRYGVSDRTVRNWIERGYIDAIQPGGGLTSAYLIEESDLESFTPPDPRGGRPPKGEGMKLTGSEIAAIEAEGFKDVRVAEATRDRNGYPRLLVEAISTSENTKWRAWLKEGESVRDMQWHEAYLIEESELESFTPPTPGRPPKGSK